jgi:hypothetical protein
MSLGSTGRGVVKREAHHELALTHVWDPELVGSIHQTMLLLVLIRRETVLVLLPSL